MFRSIDLCVVRDACHELICAFGNFYASGTQDAKLPKSLEVYCICSVTIIRFSLRCPFKKEGNPPPTPPPHPCADPVRYIKKMKITNKRTTHYAIKILITIFCYGKGIEGKMCLQHSTLLVQWR